MQTRLAAFAAFFVVFTLLGICTLRFNNNNISLSRFYSDYFNFNNSARQTTPAPTGIEGFNLDFFPKNHNFTAVEFFCENLFSAPGVGTGAANFRFSDYYTLNKKAFDDETKKWNVFEGYSAQLVSQYSAIHYMGSSPNVRRICETGFNAGHSSFNWLTSNDRSSVHSFDLGAHIHADSMAKYLMSRFNGRLQVTFGNSVETIPKFFAANPHYRCNIIFVDGGHTYPVARADLLNFISMAASNNIIIIDDHPTVIYGGVTQAWNEVVTTGRVKELMKCTYGGRTRGFAVGTVVK